MSQQRVWERMHPSLNASIRLPNKRNVRANFMVTVMPVLFAIGSVQSTWSSKQ
jgi:hypothetical protein